MSRRNGAIKSESIRDLGFGTKAMHESVLRLLNRDGTFNVSRGGLPLFKSLNLYQVLLRIPWWQFFLTFIGLYLLLNLCFAVLYYLSGPQALSGIQGLGEGERLLETFFFSVQTLTTVGYGHITPQSLPANLLVVLEAFLGLSGFALAAALIFARFSRPTAKILFSNQAVIGPYHDTTSFSFRIANGSPNELIEVEVRILLCMTQTKDGVRTRYFHELGLERQKISFFPMDWTVAHPITVDSPLYMVTSSELQKRDAEFLVLINAVDDNSCQEVHARASYKWNEVIWDARFRDMYRHTRKGRMGIDLKRIHDIQEIDSPDVPSQTVWDI